MPKNRNYRKYDIDTGETLEEGIEKVYTIEEIKRRKKISSFLKTKNDFEMQIDELGAFYFLFFNKLNEVDIDNQFKTRYLFLSSFSNFDDGLMTNNGIALKKKDVYSLLGLCEKRARETVDILMKNNLIYQLDKKYYVNRDYIIKGRMTKDETLESYARIFITGIRKLYKQCKITQHCQLYYVYQLLPYVNKKFNCICQNPLEEDYRKLKPISLKNICDIVGYNNKNDLRFWNELRKFKIENENIISSTIIEDIHSRLIIKINPKLYYLGGKENLKDLQELCYEFYIKKATDY